jgi:outer membrane immunogenic protein
MPHLSRAKFPFALLPRRNRRDKKASALLGLTVCKLGVAFVALGSLIATPIMAADMAIKAPMATPPAAYSWTGWYAGLNIGGGWGQSQNTFIANLPPPTLAGRATTQVNGVIGGGQLGYNWQSGTWVLGVETDVQGAGQHGSSNTACTLAGCLVPGSTIAETDKLTWFGTTRARVGVTSSGWLAYVTGGAAYGGINATGITTLPGFGTITVPKSSTQSGWTVGGGIEALLTGKWTWKVEYLYMDLGTLNASVSDPFLPGATAGGTAHFTDNILRGGVNLRF